MKARRPPLAVLLTAAMSGACGSPDGGDNGAPEGDAAVVDGFVPGPGDLGVVGPTLPGCAGAVRYIYDPPGEAPSTFPDDFYTVEDFETRTGLRVKIDPETAPWLVGLPDLFRPVYLDLNALDGWGTTAGVMLQFEGGALDPDRLPSGVPDSVRQPSLMLLSLADGARRIPFEATLYDEGATLMLWPMVPLAPGTEHAVIATTSLEPIGGGCVQPSEVLAALLASRGEGRLAQLAPRYRALLEDVGLVPEQISAAVLFTTQSLVDDSVAVATDVKERELRWTAPVACEAPEGVPYSTCTGRFRGWDYRDDQGVIAGTAAASPYEMPVQIWMPRPEALIDPVVEGPPWPVVIFGHGLANDRQQGEALARVAAPIGIMTVAIDAVEHGEHPGGTGGDRLLNVLRFFGVDLAGPAIKGLVLRDNFRQSTYDKLQLVELLQQATDLDGDGVEDIDPDHLMYLGVSLGGIMGSELAALSDRVGAVSLLVGGGRITSIVSEGEPFAPLLIALRPRDGPESALPRFMAVLQTVIERGDGANYAPFLLDRLAGAGERMPQVLLNMVIGDAIVPNVSNRVLARAVGAPQLPPVLQPVGLVPLTTPPPVASNIAPDVTAGLFQYDRITGPSGAVEAAAHANVARSPEALLQTTHFMRTWLERGVAEIIDPYERQGTPPLAQDP